MKLRLLTEWRPFEDSGCPWPQKFTPDVFYARAGSGTFLFRGQLLLGRGDQSHEDMLEGRFDAFWKIYGAELSDEPEESRVAGLRSVVERDFLVGRCGVLYQQPELGRTAAKTWLGVAFWNQDRRLYDELMQDCLEALIRRDRLRLESIVSTPEHENATVNEWLYGEDAPRQQATPAERQAMLRDLHLKRGDDKRQALRALGARGSAPHPWAAAAGPGQKWWAMQSEAVQTATSPRKLGQDW